MSARRRVPGCPTNSPSAPRQPARSVGSDAGGIADPQRPTRRTTNTLTDNAIRRARPKDAPYRLRDGEGLALVIPPAGARWWRFDYRFAGKPRTISLGVYPTVTLSQARERRLQARRDVDAGVDPSAKRQREKHRARIAHQDGTFEAIGREWLEKQRIVRAESTMTRNEGVLTRFAFPALGRLPIGQLEPPDLLAMLRPLEAREKHETAHRLRELCGAICRYAVATGRAVRDPTADLRGALTPVPTAHYGAVTSPEAIGALLRALDGYTGSRVVAYALRLAPLVFVRPGELRGAEWSELDLDQALWRIPSQRVKTRETHLVPLSRQAVELFTAAKAHSRGSRYVFPSSRTIERPLSDMALAAALRRLGYDSAEMTPHGFRALARTALDEQLHVRAEIIELQLAHVVPGALGATYNRSQYLDERRAMMQRWADYLDELRQRARR